VLEHAQFVVREDAHVKIEIVEKWTKELHHYNSLVIPAPFPIRTIETTNAALPNS
jgi:hypothetical protein